MIPPRFVQGSILAHSKRGISEYPPSGSRLQRLACHPSRPATPARTVDPQPSAGGRQAGGPSVPGGPARPCRAGTAAELYRATSPLLPMPLCVQVSTRRGICGDMLVAAATLKHHTLLVTAMCLEQQISAGHLQSIPLVALCCFVMPVLGQVKNNTSSSTTTTAGCHMVKDRCQVSAAARAINAMATL